MHYDLLLSTALAPPISYFTLLYHHQSGRVGLEAAEHYIKQSYRNRCYILGPNGVQPLSIPVELPEGTKTPITEVRLSTHNQWRSVWHQTLATDYGASPYYEYYIDELEALWSAPEDDSLWGLNLRLLQHLCLLLEIDTASLCPTETFTPLECHAADYRYSLRPKQGTLPPAFVPQAYHQLDRPARGFVPELSILDLLFNMGPESPLILQASYHPYPHE